jgi:signal transduction histidine kinase
LSDASSFVATEKQLIVSYMPTLLLGLVLLGLCLSSVIWAENTIRDDTEFHALIHGKFAATEVSDIVDDLKHAAQEAGLEGSGQRAVNILIGAVIIVALIAVGVVAYLNIALVRARRQLRVQTADLRETKLQKERFLSSATHELNTPLTVTSALTDVLARNSSGNLNDRQIRQLAAVQRNNRHLTDMVDVMIRTSAAGLDHELPTEPVTFSKFITGAIDTVNADMELQGVTVERSVLSSEERVSIDSERIGQVLSNLMINAGQNSPEGAIVFVSTEKVGNTIKTCVRDFGPGIPSAERQHVFSPFYRGDSESSRRNRGVGLGLTLSKRIVEDHGGEIGFEDIPGESGVTFCFTLPIVS